MALLDYNEFFNDLIVVSYLLYFIKRKFIQHKSFKYLPLYPEFINKYDPINYALGLRRPYGGLWAFILVNELSVGLNTVKSFKSVVVRPPKINILLSNAFDICPQRPKEILSVDFNYTFYHSKLLLLILYKFLLFRTDKFVKRI